MSISKFGHKIPAPPVFSPRKESFNSPPSLKSQDDGTKTYDSVQLQGNSAPNEAAHESSWMSKAGLGIAVFAAVGGMISPMAQAAELSVRDHNFETVETLVYAKGDEAPRGEALDLLEEYANTDFGAPMIAKMANDAKEAVEDGFLSPNGRITDEGEFEGFQPFRIRHGEGAQGGANGIFLPETFPTNFRHSGQKIHPLSIVHHEIGHTKYGTPAKASDIVTDEHGSRYHVEHEMDIVEQYENPVRVLYGFQERLSYTNHLGETAEMGESPTTPPQNSPVERP